MRSVFGIVALLVTLAIVALVVKQQMRATGLVASPAVVSTPGGSAPASGTPVPQTPQAQLNSAQQQVMQGIADADRQAQQQRDAAEQAAGK